MRTGRVDWSNTVATSVRLGEQKERVYSGERRELPDQLWREDRPDLEGASESVTRTWTVRSVLEKAC